MVYRIAILEWNLQISRKRAHAFPLQMTVVLTTKYLEMRARLQPGQSMAEDTRLVEESVEPDWIREADQISDELGSLKAAITSLEQKQAQKRQETF